MTLRTLPHPSDDADTSTSSDVVRVLVENHARFLAFLERRLGRRDVAEEILQEAFVRGIDKAASLREDESAVAWFYRLLRNALVDHYRKSDVENRALHAMAAEPIVTETEDEALMQQVCACVVGLLDTLKPEYAQALQKVDVDGESVATFAAENKITPNNASVRLHRAREALRRQLVRCCGSCTTHGCLDCSCS